MKKQPIGIFDSGVGGLTIFKEIRKRFPYEDLVYFADTKNCPYGNRSKAEIISYSQKITEFLISLNCKLVIVACNTATAAAITFLRKKYNIPFIGMEPALKPASLQTQTGTIGILATRGTFQGELFLKTSNKFASDLNLKIQSGEGLVELVESNNYRSIEAEKLLRRYIEPMLEENADELVLGCTHYPLFIPLIKKIVGEKVKIIDSSQAIANRLKAINPIKEVEIMGKNSFYASKKSNNFHILSEGILNLKIEKEKIIDI